MSAGFFKHLTRRYGWAMFLVVIFLGLMTFGAKPSKTALAYDNDVTVNGNGCSAKINTRDRLSWSNIEAEKCYVSITCTSGTCGKVTFKNDAGSQVIIGDLTLASDTINYPTPGYCRNNFSSSDVSLACSGSSDDTTSGGTTTGGDTTGGGTTGVTTDNSTCTATLYENTSKQVATGSGKSRIDDRYFASDAKGAGVNCWSGVSGIRANAAYCVSSNGKNPDVMDDNNYTAKCTNYSVCGVLYQRHYTSWLGLGGEKWHSAALKDVLNTKTEKSGNQTYQIEAVCTPGSNNSGGGTGTVTMTPATLTLPVKETRSISVSQTNKEAFAVKCTYIPESSGTRIEHANGGSISGGYSTKNFSADTTTFDIRGNRAGNAGYCTLYRPSNPGTILASISVVVKDCGTEGKVCCDTKVDDNVNGCADGLLCKDENGTKTCVKDTTPVGVECGGDGEICCVNANDAPADTNTPKDGCDAALQCTADKKCVQPTSATTITLKPSDPLKLVVGADSAIINITVKPSLAAGELISVTSNDKKIATVVLSSKTVDKFQVHGVAVGSTKITVTANGVTKDLAVTVTAAPAVDQCPKEDGPASNNGCPVDPATPPAAPNSRFARFLAGNECADYLEGIATGGAWNLMTSPFDLSKSGVSTLDKIMADSPTIWSYDNALGGDYFNGMVDSKTAKPGRAFWLQSGFSRICLVGTGYKKVTEPITVDFPANAVEGYEINMTGNPFSNKALSWNNVTINGASIQSGFADGMIIGIFTYDPADETNTNNEYDVYYDQAKYSVTGTKLHGYSELKDAKLNPYQGYWLMTKDGTAITVTYTP
jgi:hypothetical protein